MPSNLLSAHFDRTCGPCPQADACRHNMIHGDGQLFDACPHAWTGGSQRAQLADDILAYLSTHGAATATQVSEALEGDYFRVYNALQTLLRRGHIRRTPARPTATYSLPDDVPNAPIYDYRCTASRDALIRADAAAGLTSGQLAGIYHLSQRQVQRILHDGDGATSAPVHLSTCLPVSPC